MGGGNLQCFASEDESSLDNDEYPEFPCGPCPYTTTYSDEDESVSGSNVSSSTDFVDVGHVVSSNPEEFDACLRRRQSAYKEVIKSYDELWVRRESLHQAKINILRYAPGAWISDASGKTLSNYVIPKTTLLLIGPQGSGKSSLINKISRVFEDDNFASARAQVTYDPSSGEGTHFLQEYMIPRGGTSFCLFDTRSLSEKFVDNDEMLQNWMMKGVRHGELVIRDSDSSRLKIALRYRAQQSGSPSSELRKVNFVIYVVNGYSVLKCMNSSKEEDRRYMEIVKDTYGSPYLSFKDDKPVIAVTHGDLLSLGDRARIRVYLGEKLGVPPAKQVFDIPDTSDPSTELVILDMIRYSLEHADKNLPYREKKEWVERSLLCKDALKNKFFGTPVLRLMFLAILLGIACVVFPMRQSHKANEPVFTPVANWQSKTEVHHKPLVTSASDTQSKPAVNHSQDNQGNEIQESQVLWHSEAEAHQPSKSQEPVTTSTSDRQSRPDVTHSYENEANETQEYENEEPQVKSPSNSAATTSSPTQTLKSTPGSQRKKHQSRSPSPESRHPKAAVKWHKIRHLWLDSD